MESQNFLIVGLGNPGVRYSKTRHNAGFLILEDLAASQGGVSLQNRYKGEFSTFPFCTESGVSVTLHLLKPQTFMNRSGESVGPALSSLHLTPEDMIVIHDEIDLPTGEVRLKIGGGHRGHNGIRDIISAIDSPDFARVRFGVGRPPADSLISVADWVLGPFLEEERDAVVTGSSQALRTIFSWIESRVAAHQAEE